MLRKLVKDPVIRFLLAIIVVLFGISLLVGNGNVSGIGHYPKYFSSIAFYILIFYLLIWPFLQKSLQRAANRRERAARYSFALVGAVLLVFLALLVVVEIAFSGGGL